ncbi:MAG: HAD-IIA family hydrolase [Clostridia bacterium]|nr:HAD-IIA family hydrolase [Clostridia bacterium]
MADLKDITLFLLDMDGTVNLGYDPIDGAKDFLCTLKEQGKNYIFLTNNSSKSASDYVEKMRSLGFPCESENVFTSGMAAGMFLEENKKGSKIFVCGTQSLKNELKNYDVDISETGEDADTVLLGYDTELDYKKIRTVCDLLDGGADYYATNIDMVCPIEGGRYLPDCGSFADMFEQAVKRRPRFLGKPDRTMIDIIAKAQGVPYENIAMVGDRIYTDVKTGINAGVTSVLVLSGETTLEDYKNSDVKPDYILDSVKDIYEDIKGE